jgi:hypothetical protein
MNGRLAVDISVVDPAVTGSAGFEPGTAAAGPAEVGTAPPTGVAAVIEAYTAEQGMEYHRVDATHYAVALPGQKRRWRTAHR